MTIKNKLYLLLGIVFIFNLSIGFVVMLENGKTNDLLRSEPQKAITNIENSSYLNNLSQQIRYYDEVLTQSARNYAFTGDTEWKNRYNENAPKLDTAITDAISKGDENDKKIFENINDANVALVAMETESMQMVDAGNRVGAQTILDSPNYLEQKSIYKAGIDKYYTDQGIQADSAITESFTEIDTINQNIVKKNTANGYYVGFLITTIIILAIIVFILIYYTILKPINNLIKATKEVASGNLDQNIEVKNHDEIGTLSDSFNKMTAQIKESKQNIESKVTERTEDLNKLNKYMTGRELKMIELKKRVVELSKDLPR